MKPAPIPVTAEDLWATTSLDLWTGRLYPLTDDRKRFWKVGTPLGTTKPAPNGYHYVSFNGKRILLHRLVFKWVYGVDPTCEVDHIDRVRTNNSPFNLRLSSRRGQAINTVRHVGAYGVRQVNGRWHAYHSCQAKLLTAGGFDTEAEALAARKALVAACNAIIPMYAIHED